MFNSLIQFRKEKVDIFMTAGFRDAGLLHISGHADNNLTSTYLEYLQKAKLYAEAALQLLFSFCFHSELNNFSSATTKTGENGIPTACFAFEICITM